MGGRYQCRQIRGSCLGESTTVGEIRISNNVGFPSLKIFFFGYEKP